MPVTALYVKPRSLPLSRLGGQGSGSIETGTFWGGYGGEQTPHRSPRRPLPPTPGHEPRSPGPGSPAAPSGAVGRSPKRSATPGGTPSGGVEPAAFSEPSRASGQHRPAPPARGAASPGNPAGRQAAPDPGLGPGCAQPGWQPRDPPGSRRRSASADERTMSHCPPPAARTRSPSQETAAQARADAHRAPRILPHPRSTRPSPATCPTGKRAAAAVACARARCPASRS